MSKKGGGFNPFGGLFDFNRDGKTDFGEQWLAMKIFEECTKESNTTHDYHDYSSFSSSDDDYGWREYCDDGSEFGVDPEDYETEEEYDEALAEAKVAWRDTCDDGSEFGVDPEDYETEDEYNDALTEAKYAWRKTCEDGFEFHVDPEDYETEDEYDEALAEARVAWRDFCEDGTLYGLDPEDYETEDEYNDALSEAKVAWRKTCKDGTDYGVDPEDYETEEEYNEALSKSVCAKDYPNHRKYNAANELACIKAGFNFFSDEDEKNAAIRKCEFILNSPEIIAAQYMTHEGEFLYAQAVKENFKLPAGVEIEDEDDQVENYIDEVIQEIANENPQLALDVWLWCIDQFYPYRHFDTDETYIVNCMLYQLDSMPDEFIDALLERLKGRNDLMRILLQSCEDADQAVQYLGYKMLEKGDVESAKNVVQSFLSGNFATPDKVCSTIEGLISYSMNYDELETAERFKENLLPIFNEIQQPKVQKKLKKWATAVDSYISEMERTDDKYAYSRLYAWRANCQDGSEWGVDPLDYDTEEEYNKALLEVKYEWREWCADEAREFGLTIEDYETQESFESAVAAVKNRKDSSIEELEKAVDNANDGVVWYPEVERACGDISFEFLYPNGKNGDIDMYIAGEYGTVEQVSPLKYRATIPVKHKEQIALMNNSYLSNIHPSLRAEYALDRSEINDFLSKYNLCASLSRLNRDAMDSGMSINYPLRKQAEDIRVAYFGRLRDERRKLYADMVSKGASTTSKWKSEQQAYALIKSLYPDALYQYKAEWLGFQSLDIYIPSIHVAIEYQGAQHFHAVPMFGGDQGLSERVELDTRKRKLCAENGVQLIEWRYDEPLSIEMAERKINDALAVTDKEVYTFCGVVFPHGGTVYHYRTDDDTLTIGDMVIVPVGDEGKESVVEIVSVEKHRRKTAPYPVDKAKFIKERFEANGESESEH